MFPTIKGQKFTHLKGTIHESKGLIVRGFGVVLDDKEYATLAELLTNNPINRSISVHVVGSGVCSILDCTIES